MERERNSINESEGHAFIYSDGETFSASPLAELWHGYPDGQQSEQDYDTTFEGAGEAYYHWQEDEEYLGRLNDRPTRGW